MKQPSNADIATSALREELEKFNSFAERKLQNSGHESLEELLGLWRDNHPVARTAAHAKAGGKSTAPAKGKSSDNRGVPYL